MSSLRRSEAARLRLALLLLVLPGCMATWRREQVRSRMMHEHYTTVPIDSPRMTMRELWDSVQSATDLGCLDLVSPCRLPRQPLCFLWGKDRTCFDDTGHLAQRHDARTAYTEQWVYEQLDPQFAATKERAVLAADAEVLAEETVPPDANSFWATTRAVVQMPVFSIGQQFQAGYRRWLEHYLLLSFGGGYERTYTTPRGFGEPRDAILFTARFELSVLDEAARRRLNIPSISAYVGLTGVLGVTPTSSWMTRGFLGISASVVPLSIELGYALGAFQQGTLSQFYVAAGLAI